MKLQTKFFSLFFIFSFLINVNIFSQSDQYFGVESGFGSSIGGANTTYIGLTYENVFSNHWGIETGILSKNTYDTYLKYQFLEIPLSLKYYSKAINISCGLNSGLFTGAQTYSNSVLIWNTSFKYEMMVKVSHEFEINNAFSLEPAIICIPLSNLDDNVHFGLGVKLKYLL